MPHWGSNGDAVTALTSTARVARSTPPALARYRKAIVAALGLAAQGVNAGVLPEQYQPWGAVILAAATAAGVYGTPNATIADGAGRHRA